jgi:hypothetical protein
LFYTRIITSLFGYEQLTGFGFRKRNSLGHIAAAGRVFIKPKANYSNIWA